MRPMTRMDRWIPAASVDATSHAVHATFFLHLRKPLFSFPHFLLFSMAITEDLPTSQFNCFQAISFPTLISPAAQSGVRNGKPQGTGLVVATSLLCCHSPWDDFPVH